MASPTLTLALIAKNEEKNINRLLDSVEGCMDEIVLVDTGSTDRTKEIALERGCKVYDFEWVNSFCKARNFAFSKATQDYILWLDLDDVLFGKEGFLEWKKSAMEFADCYFATYHYALDKDLNPTVSFVRERVFKRSLNPTWQYDLHEGIILKPEWTRDYAVSWSVKHMRDAEDMKQDRSRNITLLEGLVKEGKIDARLQFYYGKELFENNRQVESIAAFEKALSMPGLEHHDRLLSYQYMNYAYQYTGDMVKDELREEKWRWYDKAVGAAIDGLKHDPVRAEFYVGAADSYLKKGELHRAKPLYAAAKNCINFSAHSAYASPVYNFKDCYGELPTLQLSKINFNLGQIDEAEREAKECIEKYKNKDAENILSEVQRIKPLINLDNNQEQTDDIVISCPPAQAYEFDEVLYQSKGMGGSETALIEMARELHKKTKRNVLVFNGREQDLVAPSGVHYVSNKKVNEYFSRFRPHTHIAWRHNIRLTKSQTYLWCHDLMTNTVEFNQNFDKLLCLSDFHKSYVIGKQGVPKEKIVVTRNGIVPEKFKNVERKPKNQNKLVWMSSPDRGLDRAMLVCDVAREMFPDLELHVYYGLDNLKKYGMLDLANKLESMMADRPYVKYHGFTEQSKMYHEVSDAVIWVHPCNFIETFCITALEMLELGIFPVTRRLGALANTLSDAESKGQAVLLDHDCVTQEEIGKYAYEVCMALREKKWERVNLDIEKHSWSSVADEWVQLMGL